MKEKVQAPELRFPGFTDDWEERKLGQYTKLITKGTTPKDKTGIGDVNFVKVENITNGKIYPINKIKQNEHDNYLKRSRLEEKDILFSIAGTLGRTAIVNKSILPANTNQALAIIRGYDFDTNFLITSLAGNVVKEYIRRNPTVGAQPNLSLEQVGNLLVNTPNAEEQQKIGSFFKQLDNTIALHQRKLDLLKEQKKGYLQKMFPKNGAKVPELRFEGFTDAWGQRKLIDVKDNEDRYSYTGGPFGSDLKSSDYTEIGVRIIQLQNIGDGKFVNDYKIYTSEEKARSLNSNLIYPGEIIIAKMADPLARATILPKIEPKYLMASDGIRLKINTDYFDNYYILTLINSDVFRKEALNNSTGTTRKRIGLVTLGNLPMMIPSFEEQQKIGSFFKQLDDTIALHQRKLDLLKEQKKGYLQKMFI